MLWTDELSDNNSPDFRRIKNQVTFIVSDHLSHFKHLFRKFHMIGSFGHILRYLNIDMPFPAVSKGLYSLLLRIHMVIIKYIFIRIRLFAMLHI